MRAIQISISIFVFLTSIFAQAHELRWSARLGQNWLEYYTPGPTGDSEELAELRLSRFDGAGQATVVSLPVKQIRSHNAGGRMTSIEATNGTESITIDINAWGRFKTQLDGKTYLGSIDLTVPCWTYLN